MLILTVKEVLELEFLGFILHLTNQNLLPNDAVPDVSGIVTDNDFADGYVVVEAGVAVAE